MATKASIGQARELVLARLTKASETLSGRFGMVALIMPTLKNKDLQEVAMLETLATFLEGLLEKTGPKKKAVKIEPDLHSDE